MAPDTVISRGEDDVVSAGVGGERMICITQHIL